MKTKLLITSFFLALLLVLVNFTGALAVPPIGSSFEGTVKISGANVPVGTAVTAWCGGRSFISSPYEVFLGTTIYHFTIPGDDPASSGVIEGCTQGQTIIFKVGTYTADQTGTWQSGIDTYLDLTVSNPTAAPVTISGDAGIGGATITYTGGSTTANTGGIYSFTVDAGWTGVVTPSLPGYTFSPGNRTYINVMDNQPDQNYTATLEDACTSPPARQLLRHGQIKREQCAHRHPGLCPHQRCPVCSIPLFGGQRTNCLQSERAW